MTRNWDVSRHRQLPTGAKNSHFPHTRPRSQVPRTPNVVRSTLRITRTRSTRTRLCRPQQRNTRVSAHRNATRPRWIEGARSCTCDADHSHRPFRHGTLEPPDELRALLEGHGAKPEGASTGRSVAILSVQVLANSCSRYTRSMGTHTVP